MNIGAKISKHRKDNGLSQEQLAERLNVSRQTVSKWESNNGLPDAYNLVELSKLFNVTTDYLLRDDYGCDNDIPQIKTLLEENSEKKKQEVKHTLIKTITLLVLGCGLALLCDLEIPSYFGLGSPLLFILADSFIMVGVMQGYKYWYLTNHNNNHSDQLSRTSIAMVVSGTLTLLISYGMNRFTYHEILFFMLLVEVVTCGVVHQLAFMHKK